jgi:sugar lactone lactonase YvrE
MLRSMRVRVLAGLCLLIVTVPAAFAAARTKGDVKLFATVPAPGAPAAVVIAPNGTVYTATLNAETGDTKAPSKVFAFTPDGKLKRTYDIQGQDLSQPHGITGLAMDADGMLYAASIAPPMVFKLDPSTGKQSVYATLRDVPPCSATVTKDCSKGTRDFKSWPDYVVLAPDGSMYVTDSLQSLIWKVAPGGGKGEIWLTDDRLQSLIGSPGFGPSAMKLAPDHRTLYFTTVEGPTGDGDPSAGRIWKVPIQVDGKPGELKQFYVAQSADGPGGIGFAKSGKLYVAMSGSSQIAEIGPDGKEIGRFPDPVANSSYKPPLDSPVDVAFRGDSLIVANSAFLSNSAQNFALLDVFVGEPGYEPLRPRMAPSAAEVGVLRLKVSPTRVPAGKRVRVRFEVTAAGRPLPGADVRIGRTHVRTDARGRAAAMVLIRRPGTRRVSVRAAGYRPAHALLVATGRR